MFHFQEGIQRCTAEENVVQSLILEEIVEVVRLVPQEQMSERICEQVVEVPVPQVAEKLIGVPKIASQERILQRAVEQIVDVPAPRPFELTAEQTEIVEMVQIITPEGLQQRTVEQLVEIAVPHVLMDFVEVVWLVPQERLSEHTREGTLSTFG